MDQPAPRRTRLSPPRLPVWALGALFPLALVPFATVHDGPRAAVGLAAGLLGIWSAAHGLSRRRPTLEVSLLALGGGLALLLSALPLIPVGAGLRASLQPGLADVVEQALSLAGGGRAPLALDPHNALMTWAVSAQALLLAVGAALAVRNSARAARLAAVLLGAGMALVVIAAAHRLTGAQSIWWVTEVPSFSRAPFFGPFVNPNHGGVACAMLLPLAASFALSRRSSNRIVGVVALSLLLVGLRLSGSRGALLAGAAGLVVFAGLTGGRRVRLGIGGAAALAGLVSLAIGPDVVGGALSEWLVPEALGPGEDLYTGRGEIWGEVLTLVSAAPILGVGHAGFDDGFHVVKTSPTFSRLDHAHQELLQVAAEHGVIVLAIWALLFTGLALAAARRCLDPELSGARRRVLAGYLGGAAALLAACNYTFPLRIGALELLGALIVGATAGLAGGGGKGRLLPAQLSSAVCWLLLFTSLGAQGLAWGTRDHDSSRWGSADAALARGEAARARGAEDGEAYAEALDFYALSILRQPMRREPMQLMSLVRRFHVPSASYADAVRPLEVATRVYPTLPWPHRDLARLQHRAGDYEAARASWRAALACDLPEGVEAPLTAEALKGPGAPAEILAQAIPDRADRQASAGRVLEDAGEVELADAAFRRAAELDPRYAAHLGAAMLRRGRPADAVAAARSVQPPSCYSLRVEAKGLWALQDAESALSRAREALSLCEDAHHLRELRMLSAEVRLSQGDARALEVYEALLAEEPEDHAARRALIAQLRARGWEEQLAAHLRALSAAGVARPAEQRELAGLAARGISGR